MKRFEIFTRRKKYGFNSVREKERRTVIEAEDEEDARKAYRIMIKTEHPQRMGEAIVTIQELRRK